MFKTTKAKDEEDSDSDWDSLSGDAEPRSEHGQSSSPRPHPPTSPNTNNSTRIQTPNVKNTSTPLKSNVDSARSTNLKPGRMYGKSAGVTTFVDRGDYDDSSSVDKRQEFSSPPMDSNLKRISSNTESRRKEKPSEMNQVDLNPVRSGHINMGFHPPGEDNPPYDFKDALPKHEIRGGRPEQKQNKMKKAYIRNQTPDAVGTLTPRVESDHSRDNTDQEDGPGLFPSASPRLSNHRQQSNKMGSKLSDGIQEYGIDVDIPDDEPCCVPYQKKKGNGYTYTFHHGKFQYFSVVPEWREPYMKTIGERTERWLTYFWQEFFGTIGLLVDFGLIFFLELIKFIFRKVLVRLLVGFIVVLGDHLLKPVLTALFNSFLQPSLSFLWNSMVGLRNAIQPLLDITREMVSQLTSLLRGFRLFELNWKPVFDANVNNSRVSQQRRIREI